MPSTHLTNKAMIQIFLAGVSDGQKKGGVDEGPYAILQHLKQHSSIVLSSNTTVINTVDFPKEMTKEHQVHLSHHTTSNPELDASEVEKEDSESFVKLHRPLSVGTANETLYRTILAMRNSSSSFTYTLGGDHSIAIGSISAISTLNKNLRGQETLVFWIDAHADFHTPRTSPSGNIHGCPVGFLMKLPGTKIPGFEWLYEKDDLPFITKIVYFGLRDVEEEEVEHIGRYGALAYWSKDIHSRRDENNYIEDCVQKAIAHFDPQGNCAIHCSFDIDSLDPLHATSTGTPVSDGLSLDQGVRIVRALQRTGRLFSMDLVEVNPTIGTPSDVEETLTSARDLLEAAL